MANHIRLKKGYDIKLVGEAKKEIGHAEAPKTYAIKPADFKGIVPKLQVEVGSEVKCGTPLFFPKDKPQVMITSPVSGEVVEIIRGEKRVILEVKILADSNLSYEQFGSSDPNTMDRDEVVNKLLGSGAWAHLRQRPYNRIADSTQTPKAIFVSCFDSSPLAPEISYVLKGREQYFQTGLDVLKKLTDGKVHLGLRRNEENNIFEQAKGVELHYFSGPHPAGNVGVQIHHIDPINKGDIVWTLNPQDVITVGKLFKDGIYDPERTIALTGSEVNDPKYYKTRIGACVDTILKDNLKAGDNRVISGNVLFGTKISPNDYLSFFDHQITVIPEGRDPEFIGWLLPSYSRPSMSKTFLSYLNPNKRFKVNTNMHGEERAYVMTGEYEKVMPMDIFPVQLIKACLANDLEAMEALGIYEVVEEDMALCEFICTSKTPVQEILSEGLTLIEKEG